MHQFDKCLLFVFLSQVETVVFCRPSDLQLSLYRHLLASRLVQSCVTNSNSVTGGALHLLCIAALKKVCNDPLLIHPELRGSEEQTEDLDIDSEVTIMFLNKEIRCVDYVISFTANPNMVLLF